MYIYIYIYIYNYFQFVQWQRHPTVLWIIYTSFYKTKHKIKYFSCNTFCLQIIVYVLKTTSK